MNKKQKTVFAALFCAAITISTFSVATSQKTVKPNELQKQSALVINCTDQNGNVVSYGCQCQAGSSSCTSNPCP